MNEMNEMNAAPAEAANPPSLQAAPDSGGIGEHEPSRRRRQGRKPGKKNTEQQTAPVPAPAPLETAAAALQEAELENPASEPAPAPEKAAGKAAGKAPGKNRTPAARRRRSPVAAPSEARQETQEKPVEKTGNELNP
jgi:hypothetical protein